MAIFFLILGFVTCGAYYKKKRQAGPDTDVEDPLDPHEQVENEDYGVFRN